MFEETISLIDEQFLSFLETNIVLCPFHVVYSIGLVFLIVFYTLENELLIRRALSVTNNIDFYTYHLSIKLFKG